MSDWPKPKEGFVLAHFLVVADIQASYEEWKAKGAEFLTEPKEHDSEWRCYMRDPDGHLMEVGQFK